MTLLTIKNKPFTLEIDDLTPIIQGQDIKLSRMSPLPRCLSLIPFGSHEKSLTSYKIEIASEAALESIINQIHSILEKNEVEVLNIDVNPPIRHLQVTGEFKSEMLLQFLAYVPSIKEVTIDSNQSISITKILINRHITRVNIKSPALYFDPYEKERIAQDAKLQSKSVYINGTRFRFAYAPAQSLRYLWGLIFLNSLFQLYNLYKRLPSRIPGTQTQLLNEIDSEQSFSEKGFMLLITMPFALTTTAIMLWTFFYELEKMHSSRHERIRERKLEKQT